ncbi:hypothetical protein HMPREF0972_00958 [Actinomyces sp. oral taxon 848 str. F0332]|nr:hypothetical protein HMPREF0972_00958 [Actinomyces sp. oral taxon 848 str. F0332]
MRHAADKACPDIGSLYRGPPPPSALETQSPFTVGRTGRRSGAAACLNVQGSVACLNVQGSDRFCDRSPARPVY